MDIRGKVGRNIMCYETETGNGDNDTCNSWRSQLLGCTRVIPEIAMMTLDVTVGEINTVQYITALKTD